MPRPPASNTVTDTVLTSASMLTIAYCIYRFLSPPTSQATIRTQPTKSAAPIPAPYSNTTTNITTVPTHATLTADFSTPIKQQHASAYETEVKSVEDNHDLSLTPLPTTITSSSVHSTLSPLAPPTLTASAEKERELNSSRRSTYIPPTPLVGGLGKAALFIAAGRALHSQSTSPTPLFDDPYAAELAGEYGLEMLSAIAAESGEGRDKLIAHIAVRTRCFDDQLLTAVTQPRTTQQHYISPQKPTTASAASAPSSTAAASDVIRQVVVLGVGSDTRSLRLALPEYVTVWELDTAEVLTFREERLSAAIAKAGGEDALPSKARTIPLEYDVTAVTTTNANALLPLLTSHSFDPTRPTVFVLEHCLRFLRDSQVRLLLATLASLSTSHSLLLCDIVNAQYFKHQSMAGLLSTWERWSLRPLCGYDLPEAVWMQCGGWAAQVMQYGQQVGGVDADYGLITSDEKDYYLRDNLRGSTNDWPREWVIVARKS